MGITTERAAYYLMEPSDDYLSIYKSIRNKVELVRVVVQFLLDKYWENPVYEDLVDELTRNNYAHAEDLLLHHAKYICQEVR